MHLEAYSAPAASVVKPGGQSVQEVDATNSEYDPIGQYVQGSCPVGDTQPSRQSSSSSIVTTINN